MLRDILTKRLRLLNFSGISWLKKATCYTSMAGLFFFSTLIFVIPSVISQEAATGKQLADKRIKITSHKLEYDNQSKYAEFIGNVVALQNQSVINADRLKIYYEGDLASSGGADSGGNSITRIVASGNVQIKIDDREAVADTATYIVKTKVLTLTGSDAKVSQGKNIITGPKIIFYRADGRTVVEGSQKNQVKAVFFSKDQGF